MGREVEDGEGCGGSPGRGIVEWGLGGGKIEIQGFGGPGRSIGLANA